MSRLIAKVDCGIALHTALRKACDSAPTTIAWNAIALWPDKEYAKFITHIYEYFGTEKGQRIATWNTLRAAVKTYYLFGTHAGNILSYAFDQFTEEDWKGFASYLRR